MTKRGRPSRKPGLRIEIDPDMLADPAISEAAIALIKLIAPRLAPARNEPGE